MSPTRETRETGEILVNPKPKHGRRISLVNQILIAELLLVFGLALFCQAPLWEHYDQLSLRYPMAARAGLILPEMFVFIFALWAIYAGYWSVKKAAIIAHIALAVGLLIHAGFVYAMNFQQNEHLQQIAEKTKAAREEIAQETARLQGAMRAQVELNKANAQAIIDAGERQAVSAENQGHAKQAAAIRRRAQDQAAAILRTETKVAAQPETKPSPALAVSDNPYAALDKKSSIAQEAARERWADWMRGWIKAYMQSVFAIIVLPILTVGLFFWVVITLIKAGAHEFAHLARTPAESGAYDFKPTAALPEYLSEETRRQIGMHPARAESQPKN